MRWLWLLPFTVSLAAEDTFLIRFAGEKPADWSGSVEVQGGRVISVTGWQFDTGDSIEGTSWKARTKVQEFWYAPWERSLFGTKQQDKLSERGLVLRLAMRGPGRVTLGTPQGRASFRPAEVSWSNPLELGAGAVSISRAPGARTVPAPAGDEDYPALLVTRAGTRVLAWQTHHEGKDQFWVRRGDGAAEPLTDAGKDLFRVALVEASDGAIWAVWSEMRAGNWDLYARVFVDGAWGSERAVVSAPGSDIFHALAADGSGRLFLAWQSFRDGQGDIYLSVHQDGAWGAEQKVSTSPANDWEPVVAAGDGRAAIVWYSYDDGDYDIVMRQWADGKLRPLETVVDTPSFEARPQALYDGDGRLWLAWEEGDEQWGKDYVSGVYDAGMGLLMHRRPRVAVLEGGKLKQLPGSLGDVLPEEFAQTMTTPRLALDGARNPWLLFRYRTNTPTGAKPRYRTIWRQGATSFQRGGWIPAVRFPAGFGRIDAPAALATAADGAVEVVWPSDGRAFPNGFAGEHELFEARIEPGPAAELELIDFQPPSQGFAPVHPNEASDVARLRNYRATVGDATLRIVRGDMHRHTDISWDGNRDGSLFDSYRYAMDAAAMDYLGVADHGAGEMIPYNYRLGQRAVDLFTIPGKFAPLYGYERSRSYPSGHRNVMFDRSGVPVFDFTEAERDDRETKVDALYAHLRAEKGIVMSHTSATGAGTDWRDAAPEVEPLVEIYQGYRRNYEHQGAPRSPAGGGVRPAGFVWQAWEKGLKLGLQSSSDHVSTHASYGMIFVDEVDRASVLDGIRARAAYAATDNILVDFRVNGALMGSAIESRGKPRLEAKIAGTGAVRKVEVIRNNEYIHTQPGGAAELEFTYIDNDPPEGESWYYIRVEQVNGELAWASPVWVRMTE